MAIKTLFEGTVKGANAALANNASENVDIYEVPALKSAVVKEIVYHGYNNQLGAQRTIQLYVLKAGGTDAGTGVATPLQDRAAAQQGSVVAQTGHVIANTLVRLAVNLCLAAGDKIKANVGNTTGAPADATTYGLQLLISGVES